MLELGGQSGLSRIAQSSQPVISFLTVRGVNFDAGQLKRTFPLALMAAFEGMHTKPKAKKVEPELSRLPTLEGPFEPQVGFDDAVDGLSGATGADGLFQDGHQALSQRAKGGVVIDDGLKESQGLRGGFAKRTMPIDQGALQSPGASGQPFKEGAIGRAELTVSLLTPAIKADFEPIEVGEKLVVLVVDGGQPGLDLGMLEV